VAIVAIPARHSLCPKTSDAAWNQSPPHVWGDSTWANVSQCQEGVESLLAAQHTMSGGSREESNDETPTSTEVDFCR
jgi:hypothetical protein